MALLHNSRIHIYAATALTGVFVVMVSIGIFLGLRSFYDLNFGSDAVFFLSFAARIFDPSLPRIFLGHAEGHNMFLMNGPVTATNDLLKNLHFEPITFVTGILYRITGSVASLVVLYVVGFFIPLLYGAWLSFNKKVRRYDVLFFVLVLYALFPNTIVRSIEKFWPFILIYPSFLLFALSLIFKRSNAEKFIFLNALLLSREEGIILSLAGVAYEFFRERREHRSHQTSRRMLVNVAAWSCVIFSYFIWIRSEYSFQGVNILRKIASLWQALPGTYLFVGFIFLMCISFLLYYSRRLWLPHSESIALCALVLGPLALMPTLSSGQDIFTESFYLNHVITLVWEVIILTLASVLIRARPNENSVSHHRGMLWGLSIITVCFVFLTLNEIRILTSDKPSPSTAPARVVFDAHNIIPHEARVLLDGTTAQAFFDSAHPDVLEIYPGREHRSDPENFYPGNAHRFVEGFKHAYQFVVISNSHSRIAEDLAEQAGKRLEIIETSSSYTVYRVEPGTSETE